MENSLLKTRLSILWIFMTIASLIHYVYGTSSELQILQAEMDKSSGFAVSGTVFFLIPLVMAFLSVTLKDEANRRVNLVLGVIFTIINIIHIFGCPIAGSVHQILIILSTIVVSLLIVYYAWKWPKE